MSGMMEKVKAKVDNVMHKDKSHDDPSGPHSSHTANQADPSVHNTSGTHTGSTGIAGEHHGSGVGSGLGSSATHGDHNPTHATTGTTGLGSSTTATHGSTGYSDPSGPHKSGMMNKADPRVDSDRLGTAGNTAGAGGVGAGQYTESHGTTGSSLPGHSTTGAYPAGNTMGTSSGMGGHGTADFRDTTGPHSSRMANQADPRVGGVGNTAADTYPTTASGGVGHDSTVPHNSHMANQVDPRVASTSTGAYGSTAGIGHSHNDPTGPHSSHAANTADPRVGGIGSTNAGLHGSNAGVHGSNAGLHGSNAGLHGSNAGLHGSNAGVHGSNAGVTGTGEHLKTVPGEVSGTGHNNLSHRNDEDGGLPKALTEPQSHAEPHSSVRDGHVSGSDVHDHNSQHPHGKPPLKEKLNPHTDADMDGKTGIMD